MWTTTPDGYLIKERSAAAPATTTYKPATEDNKSMATKAAETRAAKITAIAKHGISRSDAAAILDGKQTEKERQNENHAFLFIRDNLKAQGLSDAAAEREAVKQMRFAKEAERQQREAMK